MARAREALRVVTSSLLAPAVLLAAALVVAVGGSGADALSSLGQLASGPEAPLSSVESVSRGTSGGTEVTDVESSMLASEDAAKRRARGSSPSSGARRARADAGGPPRLGSGDGEPGGSRGTDGSGGGGGGAAPAPGRPAPSSGQAPSSGPSPSAPSRPDPLGDTLDPTQQQLDQLLQPVKPITDGVLGGLGR